MTGTNGNGNGSHNGEREGEGEGASTGPVPVYGIDRDATDAGAVPEPDVDGPDIDEAPDEVPGERAPDPSPAHARRGGRRRPRRRSGRSDRAGRADRAASHGRRDPRSLGTRAPVVLVLAAVIVGAAAIEARRGSAGDADAEVAAASAAVPMPVTPGDDAASSTWYCAAGTATEGGGADHSVTILNPSDGDHEATLTVYTGDLIAGRTDEASPEDDASQADATTTSASTSTTTTTAAARAGEPAGSDRGTDDPVTETVEVPAGGRVSVRLGDLVEAPLAAALVEVDGGTVAVEHTVQGEHGTDTAPCSSLAGTEWHVPWGSTARDTRALIVLFNPFPTAATVDGSFMTEEGRRQPVRFQGFPVPGGSVVGVDLGDDVTRAEAVAATFRARTGRIVVERVQTYDGSLGPEGQALTLGTPGAGTEWVFPDGEASAPSPETPAPEDREDPREDDERLVTTERIAVYNPGDERAEVEVLAIASGDGVVAPQPFRLSIGAGAYEIVDYGAEERIEPGVPHTTVVRSTNGQPVVAMRVLLDQGPVPAEADADEPRPGELALSDGSPAAAARWFVPSIVDAGIDDSTVDVVVYNPSEDRDRTVELAVSRAPDVEPDAVPAPEPIEVPPGGRGVFSLDADAVAASGSAIVTADGLVVVERVVRAADGRRLSARPAIPDAGGLTVLGGR